MTEPLDAVSERMLRADVEKNRALWHPMVPKLLASLDELRDGVEVVVTPVRPSANTRRRGSRGQERWDRG